jgi:hypothetical protein
MADIYHWQIFLVKDSKRRGFERELEANRQSATRIWKNSAELHVSIEKKELPVPSH